MEHNITAILLCVGIFYWYVYMKRLTSIKTSNNTAVIIINDALKDLHKLESQVCHQKCFGVISSTHTGLHQTCIVMYTSTLSKLQQHNILTFQIHKSMHISFLYKLYLPFSNIWIGYWLFYCIRNSRLNTILLRHKLRFSSFQRFWHISYHQIQTFNMTPFRWKQILS